MRIRRSMAYLAALRAETHTLAHFRANLVAWLLYTPLQLAIVYLLWSIIYGSRENIGDFSFQDMMLYYVVIHALRKVIEPVQTVNYKVWSDINEGRLDIYLSRPLSFGLFTFSKSLATPLLELLLSLPFVLVFSWLLKLPVQTDPGVLVLFTLSVAAGFTILFTIQFLIGSLTFWFERIFGIRDMIYSVFMLFSGQLIPIALLPGWAENLSRVLPFESVYYVPATIYAARVPFPELLALHVQQLFWVGTLVALAMAVWGRGVSRYASQGG